MTFRNVLRTRWTSQLTASLALWLYGSTGGVAASEQNTTPAVPARVNPRNIWPYRDWVIKSFNDNKPFDRFTLEQIAGDLLPDANTETRVGSAFNRLLLSTEEGGAQPKDYEARMLTDRVRAVGAAWLGQTTGCAQCHDHKKTCTVHDLHATMLHQLGIDHERFSVKFQGLDSKLTGVEGAKVIKDILI